MILRGASVLLAWVALVLVGGAGGVACRSSSSTEPDDTCVQSCASAIAACAMPCSAQGASYQAYTAYMMCVNDTCAEPCGAADGCPLNDADCEQCVQTSCASKITACMSE
jgi:hypothetical protein